MALNRVYDDNEMAHFLETDRSFDLAIETRQLVDIGAEKLAKGLLEASNDTSQVGSESYREIVPSNLRLVIAAAKRQKSVY